MGRVASGKSTVAEQLSRELGWPVFASDKIRKQLAGVPLHQRGDEAAREALYAPKLSAAVYQEMQRSGINAARDNGGAVVDATFSSRDARSKLCRLAQGEGVRVVFVSVEASPQLRARRLQARDSEADVVSDARLQDMEMLDSRFEEAAANEGIECIKLQSTEDALDLEKLLVGLVECNAALHNAPSGGAA